MRLPCGALILALVGAAVATAARAQFTLPVPVAPAAPAGPAAVFATQCGTCHSLNPDDQRVGPTLRGVIGRHAGTLPGFSYSSGFAEADWVWDAARLDAWLADPQAMIPGNVMTYRQDDPAIRHTVIAFLEEQR